jgi:hypothetical protein
MVRKSRSLLGFALLLSAASAFSTPEFKAGLDFIRAHNPPDTIATGEVSPFSFSEVSELKIAATGLIRLYQLFISPQDVPACNFTPSCSRFGMSAIKRYGLFRGVLMTADRLERCNGLGAVYYPIHPETGKSFDPPECEFLF